MKHKRPTVTKGREKKRKKEKIERIARKVQKSPSILPFPTLSPIILSLCLSLFLSEIFRVLVLPYLA